MNWFLESGVIRHDGTALAGARRPARDGRRAAHPAQRAASPARRPVGGGAPGAATGVGDRPGVLGRRRSTRSPPATRCRPTTCRSAPSSTSCATATSSTSVSDRRSTHRGSSCSSTPSCATSCTRACCAATGATTTSWPPSGSPTSPRRSERADEFAGMIADHYASATNGESAARWYLVAGRQAASVHGLADARRLLTPGSSRHRRRSRTLRFDLLLARENGARPHRRPGRPAGRPRCAGHARADPRRARPGAARAGDDQPLPVAVPPQRLRRPDELAEQAIALAESHGLDDLAMEAQLWLGKGLTWEGKHDEARDALDAVARRRRAGRPAQVIAESLRYLAIVAGNVSEFALAAELLDESHRHPHRGRRRAGRGDRAGADGDRALQRGPLRRRRGSGSSRRCRSS